jgi:chromate transporter
MAFAAYTITSKVINTKVGVTLMVFAGVTAFFVHSPWLFPLLLILGGVATSFKYKKHKEVEKPKPLDIEWKNFILWICVFVGVTILASATDFLPLRLFQKFYRNGSLVLGGGQVLIPMLYTEFVEYKQYMSAQQFNIGYALVHLVPGPVFSLSAYLGVITARSESLFIQLLSGFTSAAAIFLPGTFLIFFLIKFWEKLKQYRAVKASLEGINAINSGLILAACISMYYATPSSWQNNLIMLATFGILSTQRVSTPIVIIFGILAGVGSGYV